MLNKFVDFNMVIIHQILHTYTYTKILFEDYPKLSSGFDSYISLSYFVCSYPQQLLSFMFVGVVTPVINTTQR